MSSLRAVILLTFLLTLATVCGAQEPLESVVQRGPVTATVTLSPAAPVIGDDLELTLVVKAPAGIELIMPEFGDSLDRYRVSSYSPEETVDDDGATIATQRYTLVSPLSGKHSVPPMLIEFLDRRPDKKVRPDGEPSYELLTDRLDFEVESVVPDQAQAELKPPLGELAPIVPPPPPVWPWLLGGVAILLVATPFLIKAWAHYRRLARRRSAFDIARAKLDRLTQGGMPSGAEAIDTFFVGLSSIVRRYLEDRFELRAPELTTEEFLEEATQASDLSSDHQRLLQGVLRSSDLVKFAHHLPDTSEIDASLESVRRFLEETRENAPLLDDDPVAANQTEVSHAD